MKIEKNNKNVFKVTGISDTRYIREKMSKLLNLDINKYFDLYVNLETKKLIVYEDYGMFVEYREDGEEDIIELPSKIYTNVDGKWDKMEIYEYCDDLIRGCDIQLSPEIIKVSGCTREEILNSKDPKTLKYIPVKKRYITTGTMSIDTFIDMIKYCGINIPNYQQGHDTVINNFDINQITDDDRTVVYVREITTAPTDILDIYLVALKKINTDESGKTITKNTTIPTPDGIKFMKDIQVGDHVFNKFGDKVKVSGVHPQGLQDVGLDEIINTDENNTKTSNTNENSTETSNIDDIIEGHGYRMICLEKDETFTVPLKNIDIIDRVIITPYTGDYQRGVESVKERYTLDFNDSENNTIIGAYLSRDVMGACKYLTYNKTNDCLETQFNKNLTYSFRSKFIPEDFSLHSTLQYVIDITLENCKKLKYYYQGFDEVINDFDIKLTDNKINQINDDIRIEKVCVREIITPTNKLDINLIFINFDGVDILEYKLFTDSNEKVWYLNNGYDDDYLDRLDSDYQFERSFKFDKKRFEHTDETKSSDKVMNIVKEYIELTIKAYQEANNNGSQENVKNI